MRNNVSIEEEPLTGTLLTRRQPESRPCSGATVLIVEDEEELAEILEFNFRHSGYRTVVAGDGLTACRLVGREHPDLILLDIMLPDLDGWEICRMVRSHPDEAIADTPIIMLTALGSRENRIRGTELGADAYLTKPYSVREVLLKAGQLIEKYQRQHRLKHEVESINARVEQQDEWHHFLFHELRNQLLVISGYAFYLAEKPQNLTLEKSLDYARAINRSSHYLSALAEEFMLIRQLESNQGGLPGKLVDPLQVLNEVLGLLRPSMEDHQTDLGTDLDPVSPCSMNQSALKLILSNLLENAIKYSGPGGKVKVTMRPTEEGFEVVLEDNGPGIEADSLEKIFEKFYRCPNLAERFTGSGLGLYSARTLARAMGGDISAANHPAGGASFTLRFSAANESALSEQGD